jgi:uncharacterized protein YkwD
MNAGRRCLSVVLALIILGLTAAAVTQEKPAPKLSEEERAVLAWTNQVRQEKKLPTLAANGSLMAAARGHSANMARQKQLTHELDGKGIEKRVLEVDYDYAEVGENLAGGDGPVPAFFKLWLDSAVHREHLFNERYREIGIGLVRDDAGKIYCTVVFGVQRKKR